MERRILFALISFLLNFCRCSSEFVSAQARSYSGAQAMSYSGAQAMSYNGGQAMPNNEPTCPDIYRRYSSHHSYCQPKNQSCNIIRTMLSQQEINQVIELHNSFRSVIATQQEESNGLPAASDMLLMEWDNELAMVAQQYSDQCIYEHDKPNQRRVRNFGVGQNIAIQRLTGYNLQPPSPDWSFAVSDWFEEIVYFSDNMVCDFPQPQPSQGEYRHFTEVIWSTTFRVGCGYTMYQQGNTYTRLYICNYGPSGNVYGSCVYNKGPACSKCPINTKCTSGSQYPGLCQRINNEAPYQPVKQPQNFYCNFMNPNNPDCLININGPNNWYIVPALGGNYLELVLGPGKNSTIIFTKRIEGSANAKSMCVQIVYRKGPDLAKNSQNNEAKEIFVIPSMNDYTYVQSLPSYEGEAMHQFSTYNLTLQWHEASEMKVSFAVPNGATSQFLNILSIQATDNDCQN